MLKKLLFRWVDGPWSAALILAVGVVLAFAPDAFLPMLARAFLRQWALLFGVVVLFCAWKRAWWSGTAALAAGLLVLYPPLMTTSGAQPSGTEVPVLKVAHMNVFQPNDDHADVVRTALASGADLISVQEVSGRWAQVLVDGLSADFPYHVIEPRENCYGIALFSRVPFAEEHVRYLEGNPIVDVSVHTPQGPVRVIAVHACSPGTYGDFERRNQQLKELVAVVGEQRVPTAVVGDLNTVSWDQALNAFCRRSGLREGEARPTATWPSALGVALIPIDHVLVSPALNVDVLHSFTIPGSDHRGLVAQLAFAR